MFIGIVEEVAEEGIGALVGDLESKPAADEYEEDFT
jgi:hypothetical protein